MYELLLIVGVFSAVSIGALNYAAIRRIEETVRKESRTEQSD